MQRVIVKGTASYYSLTVLRFRKRPVHTIRKRFVRIESFLDLPGCFSTIGVIEVKFDDFKAIVHASHEQVVLACSGRMPLSAPSAAADICLCKRRRELSCIKQSHSVVITGRGNDLTVGAKTDAGHAVLMGVEGM